MEVFAIKDSDFKYVAFISYKHENLDRQWAKWILDYIEKYNVPKALVPNNRLYKLGKCYRDEDEASVGMELGQAINAALEKSKYLIVVCSKQTPKSKWVTNEISYFIKHNSKNNVFLLLVEGDAEESFPKIILREFSEPFAAHGKTIEGERFRQTKERAILKLIAGIINVEFDTLWNREQRRKTRAKIIQACMAFSVLVVLAVSVLWGQNQLLKQGMQLTVDSLDQKSRMLSNVATNLADMEDYVSAVNWLLEGENNAPQFVGVCPLGQSNTNQCRKKELRQMLTYLPHIFESTIMTRGGGVQSLSHNNKYYVEMSKKDITVRNLNADNQIKFPVLKKIELPSQFIGKDRPPEYPRHLKISNNGNYIFASFNSTERLEIYNTKNTDASFSVPIDNSERYRNFITSLNGNKFLVGGAKYDWVLWDAPTKLVVKHFFVGPNDSLASISDDGEYVAYQQTISEDGGFVWHSTYDEGVKINSYKKGEVKLLKILPDGQLLIVCNDRVEFWSIDNLSLKYSIDIEDIELEGAIFSSSYDRIALTGTPQEMVVLGRSQERYKVLASSRFLPKYGRHSSFNSTGAKILLNQKYVYSADDLSVEYELPAHVYHTRGAFFSNLNDDIGSIHVDYIQVGNYENKYYHVDAADDAVEESGFLDTVRFPKCIAINQNPCFILMEDYSRNLIPYESKSGDWISYEFSPLKEGLPRYLGVWPKNEIEKVKLLLLDSETYENGSEVTKIEYNEAETKLIVQSFIPKIWSWGDHMDGIVTSNSKAVVSPTLDTRFITLFGGDKFLASAGRNEREITIHSYPDMDFVWGFEFSGDFVTNLSISEDFRIMKIEADSELYEYELPQFLQSALQLNLSITDNEFHNIVFDFARDLVPICLSLSERLSVGVSGRNPPCYCETKNWPSLDIWNEWGVNFNDVRAGNWSCKQ